MPPTNIISIVYLFVTTIIRQDGSTSNVFDSPLLTIQYIMQLLGGGQQFMLPYHIRNALEYGSQAHC